MEKEIIRLTDFIADFVKTYNLDIKDYSPTKRKAYKCSECGCGWKYSVEDKFCSEDGAKIVEYEYDVLEEEAKDNIIHMFFYFEDPEDEIPQSFPYVFVDSVEKRGDGDGYHMNYIFQRKSDGKYFYYTSYDGRIENDELRETTKKVTTVWDFESSFD